MCKSINVMKSLLLLELFACCILFLYKYMCQLTHCDIFVHIEDRTLKGNVLYYKLVNIFLSFCQGQKICPFLLSYTVSKCKHVLNAYFSLFVYFQYFILHSISLLHHLLAYSSETIVEICRLFLKQNMRLTSDNYKMLFVWCS